MQIIYFIMQELEEKVKTIRERSEETEYKLNELQDVLARYIIKDCEDEDDEGEIKDYH